MRISNGDIFQFQVDALAVTTNGCYRQDGSAVMGAGIAKAAVNHYPGLDLKLGKYLQKYGNRVFVLHRPNQEPWVAEKRNLVSFPTKEHWRQKSSLELITCSARQLVKQADKNGWQTIALPPPGCGLGGLRWETVADKITNILDDRFIVSIN